MLNTQYSKIFMSLFADVREIYLFIYLFIIYFIYCCSATVVLPFPPFLTPTPSPPFLQSILPHFPDHGSSIPVCLLAPSPSFSHYPPPDSPLVTVSLFFISKSLVLFCSFVLSIRFHFQLRS